MKKFSGLVKRSASTTSKKVRFEHVDLTPAQMVDSKGEDKSIMLIISRCNNICLDEVSQCSLQTLLYMDTKCRDIIQKQQSVVLNDSLGTDQHDIDAAAEEERPQQSKTEYNDSMITLLVS